MSNTVTEKRKSTPKIEFEERRRILFHIESLQGLPQHGWQPIASTFVSVEGLETRVSLTTECRKSGSLIFWGENMPIQDLSDSSKVHFDVKSKSLWNKTVLGRTDTFEISQLLQMQNEVGQERNSFINLVVNMNAPISSEKSQTVILSLGIREMAAANRNLALVADDVQRLVDDCQQECFKELRLLSDTINILRKTTFAEEPSLLCLLDMLRGVADGICQVLGNPETRNTNKLTVACCKGLNDAFVPYRSLSARKLGKKGERHTVTVKDMLCGAIRALESVERVLRIPISYHYEKHQLEQKQIAWTRYFELCQQSLLQGEACLKADPPTNTTLRRTQCPYHMIANEDLPSSSKVLPMDLPVVYSSDSYDRPDLVRLIGRWIFSRSLLDSGSYGIDHKSHKVFCLYGPPGCGKTQLASRMMQWLREMGCLGGYFSFDRNTTQTARQVFDALPVTLIHQACTVQPDIIQAINRTYSLSGQSVHASLEDCFDRFFTQPLLKFEEGRGSRAWRLWNPVEPLVFVIDGIGSQSREEGYPQEDAQMLLDLVDFLASQAVGKLPSYLKFLLLCRSGTGVDKLFRERGVGYVQEMVPLVENAESQFSFASRVENDYGSASNSSESGLASPVPTSPCFLP